MLRQTALFALALAAPAIAQVSESFENGWNQTAWSVYAPDCNQGGKVTLDSTTAHTGKNSIRVDGAGGYCGHVFVGTTKVPSGDVYIRTYLYVAVLFSSLSLSIPYRDMQLILIPVSRKASKALTDSHVSFITMPDSAQGTNKHLRIGGQSKILMYNRESDDATLPDLSPSGIATSKALPTDAWTCFEYHLGTDGSIQTWLNNATVAGLNVGAGASNPNSQGWSRSSLKPKITGVSLLVFACLSVLLTIKCRLTLDGRATVAIPTRFGTMTLSLTARGLDVSSRCSGHPMSVWHRNQTMFLWQSSTFYALCSKVFFGFLVLRQISGAVGSFSGWINVCCKRKRHVELSSCCL